MKPQQKAILYIRVSTDEQSERGHSLANQEEKLRSYCAQNGIEVAGFYREDHSAKTFERPEFIKLLEKLKKEKGAANLLLFLKWDRFSRNAPEAYGMINTLRKLGVEPRAIEQPLNLEIPENKIMLAIYLTSGEVENDRRSLNVIAGMRRALKDGRYLNIAPKGYRNARDENNRPCIVPHPITADLISWAFQELGTGNRHIAEVGRELSRKGLKVSRNGFWYLVRNPIYIGKIVVPAYKDEPAQIVPGQHEPLISEALFYRVQDVLDGKAKRRLPAHSSKLEGLPLRGHVMCSRCARILTGSGSKGNGGIYYYYHCTGGCKERIKASIANDFVTELLSKVSANEKVIRTFELVMTNQQSRKGIEKTAALKKTKDELATLEQRLERAQALMLDGDLDGSEYRKVKAKIGPEIEALQRKQTALSDQKGCADKVVKKGFEFLRNLHKLFTSTGLEGKSRLLGSTFPQKIVFENGEGRTNGDDNILMLLSKGKSELWPKKGKAPDASGALSQVVSPSGEFTNQLIEFMRGLYSLKTEFQALIK